MGTNEKIREGKTLIKYNLPKGKWRVLKSEFIGETDFSKTSILDIEVFLTNEKHEIWTAKYGEVQKIADNVVEFINPPDNVNIYWLDKEKIVHYYGMGDDESSTENSESHEEIVGLSNFEQVPIILLAPAADSHEDDEVGIYYDFGYRYRYLKR